MNEGSGSRTALGASLMRAVHTRVDRPRLIDDPWGDRLLSAAEKAEICRRILSRAPAESRARLERLGSEEAIVAAAMRAHAAYGGVILRSRYAEDALAAAVARGARQYVLIGAGLDSFIVRQPDFARALQIFEIDHPATQAMKRARLAEAGATVPENVRVVAADLGREPLADALARSGFSRTLPAFFSWLGVTVYLTREANRATLGGVATASAPGSELVFTYIDGRVFTEPQPAAFDRMRFDPAEFGEPWISGFDPATLADELAELGLDLVEDLAGTTLRERYLAELSDRVTPGTHGHIARARVAQH